MTDPLAALTRPHRKIPEDLRPGILTYPEITHAQADAIAELSAELLPHHHAKIFQTWTESGGTHLYVELSTGDEFHVARDGKCQKIGVQDEK